jgi:hypothetical protein
MERELRDKRAMTKNLERELHKERPESKDLEMLLKEFKIKSTPPLSDAQTEQIKWAFAGFRGVLLEFGLCEPPSLTEFECVQCLELMQVRARMLARPPEIKVAIVLTRGHAQKSNIQDGWPVA